MSNTAHLYNSFGSKRLGKKNRKKRVEKSKPFFIGSFYEEKNTFMKEENPSILMSVRKNKIEIAYFTFSLPLSSNLSSPQTFSSVFYTNSS